MKPYKELDDFDEIMAQMAKIIFNETVQTKSYSDYPQSATNAAKRALKYKDENPDNTCGTRVGWTRANQLAKREPISEETIARMASFKRHEQNKDVPYSEGCGGLMWDCWGGTAGIEWASTKLEAIRDKQYSAFSYKEMFEEDETAEMMPEDETAQMMPDDETAEMEEPEMMKAEADTFDIGDLVHFISDDDEGFGVIENIDMEANVYTVRQYALASEEFYPTDQVYNLTADQVHASEEYLNGEQSKEDAEEGDTVEIETEDGAVKGIVQTIANNVLRVEVYAPTAQGYEPTGIIAYVPKKQAIKRPPLTVAKSVHRIVARVKDTIMSEDETDGRKMGMIEGYASTYGNTDLGGDIVERGAFTQTLMHNNNRIPLLRDHEYTTDALMGVAYLSDDEKGLPFKAMMDLTDPSVASVYGKIKMMADNGLKMGVSIGYQTVKSEPAENGVRRLKELALHEISITPFPMNTEATITAAKTRKAKYAAKADVWSKIVTRRKAVTQTQDATPALVAELKTILKLIQETA